MVFAINFDVKDFEEKAKQLGASAQQIPFALSLLLNDAAFKAKRVMVDRVWPSSVNARNNTFLSASLEVARATKTNLTVAIQDKLNRGHLQQHTHGGIATPRSGNFAIPIPGMVRRGPRGVASRDKPRNLTSNKNRRVIVTSKGIFVAQRGTPGLKMVYVFRSQVKIRKDVPLVEAFNYTIMETLRTGFTQAIAKAMASAKK